MHRLLIVLCALIPAVANALYVPATDPKIAQYMSIACEYVPEVKNCTKLENPGIQFAEVDRLVPLNEIIPNDPQYSSAWHLQTIGAPTG